MSHKTCKLRLVCDLHKGGRKNSLQRISYTALGALVNKVPPNDTLIKGNQAEETLKDENVGTSIGG